MVKNVACSIISLTIQIWNGKDKRIKKSLLTTVIVSIFIDYRGDAIKDVFFAFEDVYNDGGIADTRWP